MKPTVGFDCDIGVCGPQKRQMLEVYRDYTDSAQLAGGIPILLPATHDPGHIDEQLDLVDGLVLIGGSDLAPRIYGAKKHPETKLMHSARQFYDIELARAAIRRKIPILGICGGLQLINVVCGGDLIQHVPDVVSGEVVHRKEGGGAMHEVVIEPDTRLARIVGMDRLTVNSGHHQAANRIGSGLRAAAHSADGIVEAIESTGDTFLLCVQWHPERLAADDPRHLALFEALVEASLDEMDAA